MTQPSTLPPVPPAPSPPAPWRQRTLARLVQHVRAVLPVSAVAFVTDETAESESIAWFAGDDLRAGLEACMSQLVRTRLLLLPRVEAWEAAPELMDAMTEELGEESAARAWDELRGASLITCPVLGEFGSRLGALVVASDDRRRPLGRDHLP